MSLNIELLTEMLSQDATALLNLKNLLEQERAQLVARKREALPEIIEQKSRLLDILNLNTQRRQEVLQASGLSANAAGWEEFLVQNNAPAELRVKWQEITQEFASCQQLNTINGKMITRSQQTLNQLLNLLRGKVPSPSLYDAHGAKAQIASSYTIAKA